MRKENYFSKRLEEERKRLGLSQEEAGAVVGVSREMWGKYARGASEPASSKLSLFAEAGADVNYVLTGFRNLKYSEEMIKEGLRILDNTGIPAHLKTADFAFGNIEFYRNEFKPLNDDSTPFDGEVKASKARGRAPKA